MSDETKPILTAEVSYRNEFLTGFRLYNRSMLSGSMTVGTADAEAILARLNPPKNVAHGWNSDHGFAWMARNCDRCIKQDACEMMTWLALGEVPRDLSGYGLVFERYESRPGEWIETVDTPDDCPQRVLTAGQETPEAPDFRAALRAALTQEDGDS